MSPPSNTGRTDDTEKASTQSETAADTEQFDPTRLIIEEFDTGLSVKARVVLAAAVRNPDASYPILSRFVGVTETTVRDLTVSFWRGNMETRGRNKQSFRASDVSREDRSALHDFSPKQQAVIETLATYPTMWDEWRKQDIIMFIAQEYGLDMSSTYPYQIVNQFQEFIKEYHERLQSKGKVQTELPSKPEEAPPTIRERLSRHLELPESNLDDLTAPTQTWVAPYHRVNLDQFAHVRDVPSQPATAEQSEDATMTDTTDPDVESESEPEREPETPRQQDEKVPCDDHDSWHPRCEYCRGLAGGTKKTGGDEQVSIQQGNRRYQGPSTGIDARTAKLSHLANVAAKATGENGGESVELTVPTPLYQKLADRVEQGEFESVSEAVGELLIGNASVQVPSPEVQQLFAVLADMQRTAERESELSSSTSAAARIATLEQIQSLLKPMFGVEATPAVSPAPTSEADDA